MPHIMPPDAPYVGIAPHERRTIIDAALTRLCASYIFPEVAQRIAFLIRKRAGDGDYDAITDAASLAREITADLQRINHDGHLLVLFRPVPRPPSAGDAEILARRAERHARAQATGFGIARVARLRGNIGYIDLRGFHSPAIAGESVAAMIHLVAHTHALIVDLRHHSGGDADMVTFLCSYFLGPEPVQLANLYSRGDKLVQQQWTLPFVPGSRYFDRPVYLLTSRATVSAGEALAYYLKHLGRAHLVGERTRGMANPGETWTVYPHLEVFIPTMRIECTATGGNWEGTGVTPDVEVPAGDADRVAYQRALREREASLQVEEQAAVSASLLAEIREAMQDDSGTE